MGWVPEKFKNRPFVVWAFALATVGALVGLFGRETVARWIEGSATWAGGWFGG